MLFTTIIVALIYITRNLDRKREQEKKITRDIIQHKLLPKYECFTSFGYLPTE